MSSMHLFNTVQVFRRSGETQAPHFIHQLFCRVETQKIFFEGIPEGYGILARVRAQVILHFEGVHEFLLGICDAE